MKILHTADWHLGQHLYGQKRYQEFGQFFQWLLEKIVEESIDVLLVAGDVFDTTTPSNRAQELYNNFLAEASKTLCRHMVVIGGNHDSPSLLNAQRKVFKLLQIHVVGSAEERVADEVLVLQNSQGIAELIVCAVPYLRDRDVRKSEAGESIEEKGRKLVEGIRQHYQEVCEEAQRIQEVLGHWVPIVAMGHLFTAGGTTTHHDGVRDLYIGSLGHVHAEIFPSSIDYLALGHLHAPQKVAGSETMRYSGSPLPMSFTEANQDKEVLCITIADQKLEVKSISVPRFQELKIIKGNRETIFEQVTQEKTSGTNAFLEILYTEQGCIDTLFTGQLQNLVEGSSLKILKIHHERQKAHISEETGSSLSLDDLEPIDVFKNLLQSDQTSEQEQGDLIACFLDILHSVHQEDARRE